MPTIIDDSICPLCQQINRCDVNATDGCWCMRTKIPSGLLAQIPLPIKNKSCICNSCIAQYQESLSHQENPSKEYAI